jgi:regulator of replication initiation timing
MQKQKQRRHQMSSIEKVLESARREKQKIDLEKQAGLRSSVEQKNELKNEADFIRAFDELITSMKEKATAELKRIYSSGGRICTLPFDAKTEDEKIISLYNQIYC